MKKTRLKLTTARDIKLSINRVANWILNDEIDTKKANAVLYACNSCVNVIRVDEQQAKLDELEQIVEEMGLKK